MKSGRWPRLAMSIVVSGLLAGCSSATSRQVAQQLAMRSIARPVRPLPTAQVTANDISAEAAPVARAFLEYWRALQHQAWSQAIGYYPRSVRQLLGDDEITYAMSLQDAYYRLVYPKIVRMVRERYGTIVTYVAPGEPWGTGGATSIVLRRTGGRWKVEFDPELRYALQVLLSGLRLEFGSNAWPQPRMLSSQIAHYSLGTVDQLADEQQLLTDGTFAEPLAAAWSVERPSRITTLIVAPTHKGAAPYLRLSSPGTAVPTSVAISQKVVDLPSTLPGSIYRLTMAVRTIALNRPVQVELKLSYPTGQYQFFRGGLNGTTSGIPAGTSAGWQSLTVTAVVRGPLRSITVFMIDSGPGRLKGTVLIRRVALRLARSY